MFFKTTAPFLSESCRFASLNYTLLHNTVLRIPCPVPQKSPAYNFFLKHRQHIAILPGDMLLRKVDFMIIVPTDKYKACIMGPR